MSSHLRECLVRHDRELDLAIVGEYGLPEQDSSALGLLFKEPRKRRRHALVREGSLLGLVELSESGTCGLHPRRLPAARRIRPPATVALANAKLFDSGMTL